MLKFLQVVFYLLLALGARAQSVVEIQLFKAAGQGDSFLLKFALDSGADVNARAMGGMTPLMAAVLKGQVETSKFLINRGADVNAKTTNGVTALLYAVNGGHTEIVALLMSCGADTFATTTDGITPLMAAQRYPHILKIFEAYKNYTSAIKPVASPKAPPSKSEPFPFESVALISLAVAGLGALAYVQLRKS